MQVWRGEDVEEEGEKRQEVVDFGAGGREGEGGQEGGCREVRVRVVCVRWVVREVCAVISLGWALVCLPVLWGYLFGQGGLYRDAPFSTPA